MKGGARLANHKVTVSLWTVAEIIEFGWHKSSEAKHKGLLTIVGRL